MSYILARTAVAAILASTLAGAVAADTIKIAFLGSLSGPFALQGEETLKNVQAAADLVNARGGILEGRQIEIVAFDNKGNPQESLIVLNRRSTGTCAT
jgi:branched-chain amino acid transport system substrate-binding protein